jgi:raffinose/stachyose/melibiose transport system permease protein
MKELGWIDTYQALVVPGLFGGFGVFMMRQWFIGLPKSLEEAAKLDGCNYFQTFFYIMMKLCKPVATTVVIMETIWAWNAFMLPLVLTLNNPSSRTLAVGLYAFKGENTVDWTGIAAGGSIAVIPVIILFVLMQKHFVEGIAGAVKS